MPSGTHLLGKKKIISNDSGPCLSVVWQWPHIMLDTIKVFAHSCFNGTIQASHLKVIAFVGETDKIRAAADKENNELTTLKMVVMFPLGEYQYTGRNQWSPLCQPFFAFFQHHHRWYAHHNFCLFDLMVKILDDGKRFNTKAILVDNNKCD
jgi:hypothetical protein